MSSKLCALEPDTDSPVKFPIPYGGNGHRILPDGAPWDMFSLWILYPTPRDGMTFGDAIVSRICDIITSRGINTRLFGHERHQPRWLSEALKLSRYRTILGGRNGEDDDISVRKQLCHLLVREAGVLDSRRELLEATRALRLLMRPPVRSIDTEPITAEHEELAKKVLERHGWWPVPICDVSEGGAITGLSWKLMQDRDARVVWHSGRMQPRRHRVSIACKPKPVQMHYIELISSNPATKTGVTTTWFAEPFGMCTDDMSLSLAADTLCMEAAKDGTVLFKLKSGSTKSDNVLNVYHAIDALFTKIRSFAKLDMFDEIGTIRRQVVTPGRDSSKEHESTIIRSVHVDGAMNRKLVPAIHVYPVPWPDETADALRMGDGVVFSTTTDGARIVTTPLSEYDKTLELIHRMNWEPISPAPALPAVLIEFSRDVIESMDELPKFAVIQRQHGGHGGGGVVVRAEP